MKVHLQGLKYISAVYLVPSPVGTVFSVTMGLNRFSILDEQVPCLAESRDNESGVGAEKGSLLTSYRIPKTT